MDLRNAEGHWHIACMAECPYCGEIIDLSNDSEFMNEYDPFEDYKDVAHSVTCKMCLGEYNVNVLHRC